MYSLEEELSLAVQVRQQYVNPEKSGEGECGTRTQVKVNLSGMRNNPFASCHQKPVFLLCLSH